MYQIMWGNRHGNTHHVTTENWETALKCYSLLSELANVEVVTIDRVTPKDSYTIRYRVNDESSNVKITPLEFNHDDLHFRLDEYADLAEDHQ